MVSGHPWQLIIEDAVWCYIVPVAGVKDEVDDDEHGTARKGDGDGDDGRAQESQSQTLHN